MLIEGLGLTVSEASTPNRRLPWERMLHEIEQQQSEIHESYWEIRNARDRIEAQASELERVNSIGRQLSEHIEPDRVADVLVTRMISELGATAVELWLIPPESKDSFDARLFRESGHVMGEATQEYALTTAGRAVGKLFVWRTKARGDGSVSAKAATGSTPVDTRDALLNRLLPWISMALDNARIHQELQMRATDL